MKTDEKFEAECRKRINDYLNTPPKSIHDIPEAIEQLRNATGINLNHAQLKVFLSGSSLAEASGKKKPETKIESRPQQPKSNLRDNIPFCSRCLAHTPYRVEYAQTHKASVFIDLGETGVIKPITSERQHLICNVCGTRVMSPREVREVSEANSFQENALIVATIMLIGVVIGIIYLFYIDVL